MADLLESETNFPHPSQIRIRRKARLFEYESQDDVILDPQQNFKVNFFYFVIDVAINSLEERFIQMEKHNDTFGFLYNIFALKNQTKNYIINFCKDLQLYLTDSLDSDIDALELCEEIQNFNVIINKKLTPLEILNCLSMQNMEDIFPNLFIAIRILLTLPVTVASAERSFSKLKIIKNYLRSSMSQERLVGLALISIKSEISGSLEYDKLIKEFAEIKARKMNII